MAPHLLRATGARIVFGMGGYNDLSRDRATRVDIVATYRRESALAHEAGARFVCELDVIRFDGGDGARRSTTRWSISRPSRCSTGG